MTQKYLSREIDFKFEIRRNSSLNFILVKVIIIIIIIKLLLLSKLSDPFFLSPQYRIA